MIPSTFTILYVDSPARSAAFYADLYGVAPVEASATFAMFVLPGGLRLGLWARTGVAPAVSTAGGGSEMVFDVADADAVVARHQDWAARGITIAQAPTRMDFGDTFTALDPDGHRLRVFAPLAE